MDELENIMANQRGKFIQAAKLAKQLVLAKKIKILQTNEPEKHVDQIILDMSTRETTVVATQDQILQKRLMAKKVRIIVLRQKKYLRLHE